MKKSTLLKAGLFAMVGLTVVACGPRVPQYDGTEVQGVTEDKIYIGNTAATSGVYAKVGVPFNLGLNAALKVYNDKGGFNGKTVELKHYDDTFTAETGLAFTKKLVEEDEVFALVGHFGTPTVGATLDYIAAEKGIPMVYAATGVSGLYNEDAEGYERAVMPIQPIYKTEGRMLLSRALAATEGNMGLGGSKIGVITANDEAGLGLLEGIQYQAESYKVDIKYVTTQAAQGTDHSTAVAALKTAGCDVIIIAANQEPFAEIMSYMRDGGVDNVKIVSSYVNANATALAALAADGRITATREVYTAAWLDINSNAVLYAPTATENPIGNYIWEGYKILGAYYATQFPALADYYNALYANGVAGFSQEYWKVAEAIVAYDLSVNGLTSTTAFEMSYNSYALAGYIAGTMFTLGLDRVKEAEKELTWLNYIEEMERAPLDIPMAAEVSLANGNRLGIADLSLSKFDLTTSQLAVYSPLTPLDEVIAAVPADKKK